jgi:hypothetical protein
MNLAPPPITVILSGVSRNAAHGVEEPCVAWAEMNLESRSDNAVSQRVD